MAPNTTRSVASVYWYTQGRLIHYGMYTCIMEAIHNTDLHVIYTGVSRYIHLVIRRYKHGFKSMVQSAFTPSPAMHKPT